MKSGFYWSQSQDSLCVCQGQGVIPTEQCSRRQAEVASTLMLPLLCSPPWTISSHPRKAFNPRCLKWTREEVDESSGCIYFAVGIQNESSESFPEYLWCCLKTKNFSHTPGKYCNTLQCTVSGRAMTSVLLAMLSGLIINRDAIILAGFSSMITQTWTFLIQVSKWWKPLRGVQWDLFN